MILGDGRLQLESQADRKYSLLLVDAFSSDSIPLHLLTVESVKLYFDRIAPNGLLGLHISNKYVKLEPVVAAIAQELKLSCRIYNDGVEGYSGKTSSLWCVLARSEDDLGNLGASRLDDGDAPLSMAFLGGVGWQAFRPDWKELKQSKDVFPWTDDYADVLRVMTLPEIVKLRKLFRLPTPAADE
jgi:hypothetical protein